MDRSAVTPELASRLIATQFPQWRHLPVRTVERDGWDNRTFRLGRTMSVRLPSAEAHVPQVEKEQRWLARLGSQLPVSIPEPLARGMRGTEFPRP